MAYRIRRARESDLGRLPAVEIAAGRLFAEIGMHDVAAMAPTTVEDHREAMEEGWLWVAADEDDHPVGFAMAEIRDGCAHLDELSVHAAHGRRGLGRRMIDAVVAAAREARLPAVTLSTFRHVAWNGPWYRRYGFRELGMSELTPGLLQLRENEKRVGLDVGARMFMRLELDYEG